MQGSEQRQSTIVTGVIGDDVHVVGIRILEHTMREVGYKVVSLGAQVSQEEFVNAAVEANADAILISSMTGHAPTIVMGLRDKCEAAGLKDILVYLGGHLVLGHAQWDGVEKMFRDMGLNRAYSPGISPSRVIADLEADLALVKTRR